MTSFLPHREPNTYIREKRLAENQDKYRYSHTHVSPLAMLDRVPLTDEFSIKWIRTVAERVMVALANRAEIEAGTRHRDYHLSHYKLLHHLLEAGETAIRDLRSVVSDALRFQFRLGAEPRQAEDLDDFAELFCTIGLPPIAKDYGNDMAFAYMRVAGPNPIMIRVMKEHDDRLPLCDKEFARVIEGDCMDEAMEQGRLHLADYSLLDGAELGDFPHGQKYCYAPLAMFVADKSTRMLRPVAIQCKQTPAEDNPIFTPLDGYNWLIAKTIVEIADGNIHEAYTHLARTHFFMEPFVVSTFRQLAQTHPIYRLLSPHFEGTLAINDAAWKHLIADKGAVDKLFGVSIDAARGLAVKGVQSAKVSDVLLPKTFADRGVACEESLPLYPYRDDAMLYWEAINEWVKCYVAIYYPSDDEISKDHELQAWGRELASQEGGRLAGMPNEGDFKSTSELVDVLTLVIYTCSVQHAAVNFPQYDLMSYVPNMPLASYQPAPTSKSGATEADYLAMMPPLNMAELQMELGYLLGTVHYTQLGQYDRHHFRDPKVDGPLQVFQQRISEIGGKIEQRNETRRPYEFLKPSGVPQSINI